MGARVGAGAAIGAAVGVTVGAGGVRVGAGDGVTVAFADATTEGVGAGEALTVAVGAGVVALIVAVVRGVWDGVVADGDALTVDVRIGEALTVALGIAAVAVGVWPPGVRVDVGVAVWVAIALGELTGVAEEVASGDAVGVTLAEAVGDADGDATVDVCNGFAAVGVCDGVSGAETTGCSLIAFCRGDPPCARASKADAASIQIASPVNNALKASRFVRPIMTTMPPQHSLRFQVLRARNTRKARMAAQLPGGVRVEISGFAD